MKEIYGDIWDYYDHGYNICITTNGFVKKNGCAVMGKGTAKQARDRFLGIDRRLGNMMGGGHYHGLSFRLEICGRDYTQSF